MRGNDKGLGLCYAKISVLNRIFPIGVTVRKVISSLVTLLLLTACDGGKVSQVVNVVLPSSSPSSQPAAPPTPAAQVAANAQVSVDAQIRKTVEDNINAINTQDLTALLNTIYPDSQLRRDLETYGNQVFMGQTRHHLQELNITSKSEASASASLKRRVTDITGTVDEEALYILRKSGDRWLIADINIQKQTRVAGSGAGFDDFSDFEDF